jgi:GlpG protein
MTAKAAKIRKAREQAAKPLPSAIPQRGAAESSRGTLTILLIGISVLVALATKMGDPETDLYYELLVTSLVRNGQVVLQWDEPWRLLTPMFLHYGLVHLGFNMLWLYRFGNQIEASHGVIRLLLLACLAQIAGSIAQFYISGPFFGGMSGVNYALFGFVWMQSKYGQRGYNIANQDTLILMGWLVLCATGLIGPIANASHAMGLATGLLAGLPIYVNFRRTHATSAPIEEGSWAALNLTPWQRFERTYVQPYMPLWFMAVAIGVLLLDL